jgi:hypothetical protein
VAYNHNVFKIANDYLQLIYAEQLRSQEPGGSCPGGDPCPEANLAPIYVQSLAAEDYLAKGDTWAEDKPEWNVVAVSNNPDLLAQEKAAWQSLEVEILQQNIGNAAVGAGLAAGLCAVGAVETAGGSCIAAAGVGFLLGLAGNQLWNDISGTTAKLNELKAVYDKEKGNTHNELYCPTGSCAQPGWTPNPSGGSWYSPGPYDPFWNNP